MTDIPIKPPQTRPAIPADDPQRTLAIVRSDAPRMRHISVIGDTYTILLTGDETRGHDRLIEAHVPPGGGPPPHRHDFEEMFTILEGEIEVTFRSQTVTARAGETINIPANAPHAFPQQRVPTSSDADHMRAGGYGPVLHSRRRSRGQPHRSTA